MSPTKSRFGSECPNFRKDSRSLCVGQWRLVTLKWSQSVADNPRIRPRHPGPELLLIWNVKSLRRLRESIRLPCGGEFSRPRPCASWGQGAHAVRTECRLPRPQRSSAVASRRRPDRVHRKRTSPPAPSVSPAQIGEGCVTHTQCVRILKGWIFLIGKFNWRQTAVSDTGVAEVQPKCSVWDKSCTLWRHLKKIKAIFAATWTIWKYYRMLQAGMIRNTTYCIWICMDWKYG